MGLRATFFRWVIALMVFCMVLLSLTIVDIDESRREEDDTVKHTWLHMRMDVAMEFSSEVIGLGLDLLLLIGLIMDSKFVILFWLCTAPFRVVIHLGGTIFSLATEQSLESGSQLRHAIVCLRIILAAMLIYSLFLGAHYFLQLRRRAYVNVESDQQAWRKAFAEHATAFFRPQLSNSLRKSIRKHAHKDEMLDVDEGAGKSNADETRKRDDDDDDDD